MPLSFHCLRFLDRGRIDIGDKCRIFFVWFDIKRMQQEQKRFGAEDEKRARAHTHTHGGTVRDGEDAKYDRQKADWPAVRGLSGSNA